MLELRFSAGELQVGGARTLRGRILQYLEETKIQTGFGEFRERFARNALGVVARLDVTLDLQHAATRRIARTQGGGVTLEQRGDDVMLEAVLPASRDGDDAIALVKAGVLRGFSIQFNSTEDRWEGDLREVVTATMPSVGIVDRPQYLSATGIELRRSLTNPADTEAVHVPPDTGGRREGGVLGDLFPGAGTETPKRRRGLLLWL